ncbi:TIGR03943 family putative permease subunit [Streptomyces sp. CBMA123]|uniref:TIGR03943 family putative permease subunit n=1 Tax=Streptomyces sp. CBMA123 TaxID=1896313 RepID=UPI001661A157|nr:TIGR03943 family protein [Streptomyces sp. CBMA123]MBD0691246.1 TIGR03943 family protein [Streptomyces sp. CBMA123]
MRREVRALLHILVGAAVLHISLFSELYLRYVRKGLRPYLIAGGVLLVAVGLVSAAVAARELLRPEQTADEPDAEAPDTHHGHGHGTPRTAWLLLLPVLAIYLLQPQALGAYTAQHSGNTTGRPAGAAGGFAPLPAAGDGGPITMRLADFDLRAGWDTSGSLKGRQVRLTGFATPAPDPGGWYLTRLAISCCAADALTSKVEIHGPDAPPEGAWVEVTGQWQPDGRADQDGAVPVLSAGQIRRIPEPGDPYE